MSVYTLGVWTVQAGREDEFVAAWQQMADATKEDFPRASAVLLRDRDQSNRFISTGPWESMEEVQRWRSSAAFQQGLVRIRQVLESFEPHTMDAVVVLS